MKILVQSLLRVGDFFQHSLLLDQLRKTHPTAEIHVLGFTELQPAVAIFPEFRFHLLSRQGMQSFFVENDLSLYSGVYLLKRELEHLLSQGWSKIFNLTHSKLACRLMDCFSSEKKFGARFENGQLVLESQASRYLNEQYLEQVVPPKTLIELIADSVEISWPQLGHRKTTESSGSEIWLNPLTSDVRKSWNIKNWVQLAKLLKASGQVYRVICAPQESEALAGYFDPQSVSPWTFQQVVQNQDRCRQLVTADTSLPHLLARAEIPTLMLFLGPANPYKTKPWNPNLKTLIGQTPCWPCSHKGTCSQTRQICGDQISVRQVFECIQYPIHLESNEGAWP